MTAQTVTSTPSAAPATSGGRDAERRQGQGAALCLGMLRGAVLAGHVGLLGAGLVCWLTGGVVSAGNAAVAGALVLVFFASGQAVQMLAGELANGTGMVMLMGSYLLRVALLGGALAFTMANQDKVEQFFLPTSFMAGAIVTLIGWLVGIFVANARQHVYVYDRDFDASRQGVDKR